VRPRIAVEPRAAGAACILVLVAGGALHAAEGDPVAPGQRVADILGPAREAARPAPEGTGPGVARLALAAGALLVLGAAAIAVRRRRRMAGVAGSPEPLEIVGCIALSPRHTIYTVRAAGRRIVVGVSGDGMAALAVIEDRSAEAAAPPPSRGFSSRLPAEPSRRLDARSAPPIDLDPYRKQVDRLRGILRGPFGDRARGAGEEA
jgi:flagellar protein FliO/FliZ